MLLLVLVLSTPRVQHRRGFVLPANSERYLANVVDWRSAATRGLAVLAATGLAWFAASGRPAE